MGIEEEDGVRPVDGGAGGGGSPPSAWRKTTARATLEGGKDALRALLEVLAVIVDVESCRSLVGSTRGVQDGGAVWGTPEWYNAAWARTASRIDYAGTGRSWMRGRH